MRRSLPTFVILAVTLGAQPPCQGQDNTIEIRADQKLGPISRLLTGACIEDVNHEIYGGIYSQMIFGESFQEPPPAQAFKNFTAYGGRWVGKDGEVWIQGQDGPKLVSNHAPFKEGAAGVELFAAEARPGNVALLVCVERPAVGADNFVGYEVALDAARQIVHLARHRNNYEPLQDAPCEVPTQRWIKLEVRRAGSVLEVLVDGKSILKYDDGPQALSAGKVALRPWQAKAGYRNLWVRTGERIEKLSLDLTGPSSAVSGMWRPIAQGSASGQYELVSTEPFLGTQSQRVTFATGEGHVGIENQGLNRWGLSFASGKPYEGYVWVRVDRPTRFVAALESRDGSRTYAEQNLQTADGSGWQRLDLQLTPTTADTAGRFALRLNEPGTLTLGHVFLQPGDWGRFKGLPVRRDVAEALVAQGITVLRYGGSMINHPEYRWKKMIGPRDRRPPNPGTWYPYSSNGWGIIDFIELCEAAGFEYVPAFNMGETPADMADFIDYAKAPANTPWGQRRAADGHPAPYRLKYIELGNEERVDENYASAFEKLATAIWAKDPDITLVVGDFLYRQRIVDPDKFDGAASQITNLDGHRQILRLAKQHNREVWFDVHVGTERPVKHNNELEGMLSFIDALEKIADGARHKVVVFEYNADNHAVQRALANALATQAIIRDGRVPIVTSANCLQPDGQNDNGWNQGLLFFNPAQVWLQPPGYVTQIFSQNYLPERVACEVSAGDTGLDAAACRSEDGQTLVLLAVNPGDRPVAAQIRLTGLVPANADARVTELSGPLEAVNKSEMPNTIVPKQTTWKHGLAGGQSHYTFAPHSFTAIRFE